MRGWVAPGSRLSVDRRHRARLLTSTAGAGTTTSVYTNGSGIGEQAGTGTGVGGSNGGTLQHCVDVPLTVAPDGIVYLELPLGGGLGGTIDTGSGRAPGPGMRNGAAPASSTGSSSSPMSTPSRWQTRRGNAWRFRRRSPHLSPAGDQIVNLPSWLWLVGPWAPLSSTVSVPGVRVTAVAVPEQAVWTMGDGAQIVCDGPGVAYDAAIWAAGPAPSCAYTYTSSSAAQPDLRYHAAVTVRWHATWSAIGSSRRRRSRHDRSDDRVHRARR